MGKTFETSERIKDESLKTRYYKTNIDLIYHFLEKQLKEDGLSILSINKEYGEIAASHTDYELVIKLFQFSATEAAVDLYINSNFLIDLGKTKKILIEFFEKLNKEFPLIGLGLHA